MFVNKSLILFLLPLIFCPSDGKTAEEWKGRIIYQVFLNAVKKGFNFAKIPGSKGIEENLNQNNAMCKSYKIRLGMDLRNF